MIISSNNSIQIQSKFIKSGTPTCFVLPISTLPCLPYISGCSHPSQSIYHHIIGCSHPSQYDYNIGCSHPSQYMYITITFGCSHPSQTTISLCSRVIPPISDKHTISYDVPKYLIVEGHSPKLPQFNDKSVQGMDVSFWYSNKNTGFQLYLSNI